MDDLYAHLCVHGTLPLVSDPGSPTGLRFAKIGIDLPGECIQDATGLPQVDISLHVFGSSDERNGYARALADFGDNAISFLPSAPNPVTPLLGLVIRHDRERSLSGTLDDAIRLVGGGPDLVVRFEKKRRIDLEDIRRKSERERWHLRWEREETILRGMPGIWLMGTEDDESSIEFLTGNDIYRIVRSPDGLSVVWRSVPLPYTGVVPEDHSETADALGLQRVEDGSYRTRPGALTRETIEEAIAATKELKRVMMETTAPRETTVWKYGRQVP